MSRERIRQNRSIYAASTLYRLLSGKVDFSLDLNRKYLTSGIFCSYDFDFACYILNFIIKNNNKISFFVFD